MKINRLAAWLAAAAFLAMASGCQPTPERAPIVGKGDGKLEQTIASQPAETASASAAPAPQNLGELRWQETYTVSNLICKFDPEIIVPENMIFPVYEVRQAAFTSDSIQPLVKYFTQGAQGMREAYPTKEELEKKLIQVKRGTYIFRDDYGAWEPYEGQEEDIQALEEQIRNARAEEFGEVAPIATLPAKLAYEMPDDRRAYIQADGGTFLYSAHSPTSAVMQPESWVMDGEAYPGEPIGSRIEGISLSEGDAKQAALACVQSLGLTDYGIAHTEKARILEYYSYNVLSKGWCVTLTRTDGQSIPVYMGSAQSHPLLHFGEEAYKPEWKEECIRIYVDASGVQQMQWDNPIEVTDILNDNVTLLPFSEIQQHIRDAIKYGRSIPSAMDEATITVDWYIDKIALTNLMVPVANDLEHQMLVPAWVVFFREQYLDGMTFVCAINAVDGSNLAP